MTRMEPTEASLRGEPADGAQAPTASEPDCSVPRTQETAPAAATSRSKRVARWATGGAVVSAIASSACCWLPLLLIAFGASAVGVAAFFEKYRPLFLISAALLLGLGFYYNYFRKERCAPGSTCATPKPKLKLFSRSMLWIATVFVLAFAFFPDYVGALIGSPKTPDAQATASDHRTVALALEGMTCAGCAATIEKALYRVPGVLRAEVSFGEERATVELDPSGPPENARLLEAVKGAGYHATLEPAGEGGDRP